MSQVGSAPAFRTGSPKKHELKSKQKLEKKLSFYTSRCAFPLFFGCTPLFQEKSTFAIFG
jgi:hypothetical protein